MTTNLLDMEVAQLGDRPDLEPADCRGMWLPALQAIPIGIDEERNLHLNVQIAIPHGVLLEVDRASGAIILGADGKAAPPSLQDALPLAPMVRLVVKAAAMTDEALESLDNHIQGETQTTPDDPANGV